MEYDAANRAVLAVADLNGDGAFDAGPGSPDAATRTARDAVGNPVRVTDPEGAVTDTEYDAFGRPPRGVGPAVPDWRRGGVPARPQPSEIGRPQRCAPPASSPIIRSPFTPARPCKRPADC